MQQLSRTWEELGEDDPLWAVVSHPEKRGGRWNLTEFMATGEKDISHYHQLIARHIPQLEMFSHALDFGCGVVRLTYAWGTRLRQAAGYIKEFARVCQPGGIVSFQLPSRASRTDRIGELRKVFVDRLPFGLSRLYRRWRHGTPASFNMYYTPCFTVEQTAADAGLNLIHREPDPSAGANVEGFFYIFRKSEK